MAFGKIWGWDQEVKRDFPAYVVIFLLLFFQDNDLNRSGKSRTFFFSRKKCFRVPTNLSTICPSFKSIVERNKSKHKKKLFLHVTAYISISSWFSSRGRFAVWPCHRDWLAGSKTRLPPRAGYKYYFPSFFCPRGGASQQRKNNRFEFPLLSTQLSSLGTDQSNVMENRSPRWDDGMWTSI